MVGIKLTLKTKQSVDLLSHQVFLDLVPLATVGVHLEEASIDTVGADVLRDLGDDERLLGLAGIGVGVEHGIDNSSEVGVVAHNSSAASNEDIVGVGLEVLGHVAFFRDGAIVLGGLGVETER